MLNLILLIIDHRVLLGYNYAHYVIRRHGLLNVSTTILLLINQQNSAHYHRLPRTNTAHSTTSRHKQGNSFTVFVKLLYYIVLLFICSCSFWSAGGRGHHQSMLLLALSSTRTVRKNDNIFSSHHCF